MVRKVGVDFLFIHQIYIYIYIYIAVTCEYSDKNYNSVFTNSIMFDESKLITAWAIWSWAGHIKTSVILIGFFLLKVIYIYIYTHMWTGMTEKLNKSFNIW